MSTEDKKKKTSIFARLLKYYFIFVIVWTFFGISPIVCIKTSRGSARQKACLSNCRVTTGGIEMYNMDHEVKYASESIPLDPSGTVLEGYYKTIYPPESNCEYHYDIVNTEVSCVLHGSPSNPNDNVRSQSELERAIGLYLFHCVARFKDALLLPFLPLILIFGR